MAHRGRAGAAMDPREPSNSIGRGIRDGSGGRIRSALRSSTFRRLCLPRAEMFGPSLGVIGGSCRPLRILGPVTSGFVIGSSGWAGHSLEGTAKRHGPVPSVPEGLPVGWRGTTTGGPAWPGLGGVGSQCRRIPGEPSVAPRTSSRGEAGPTQPCTSISGRSGHCPRALLTQALPTPSSDDFRLATHSLAKSDLGPFHVKSLRPISRFVYN